MFRAENSMQLLHSTHDRHEFRASLVPVSLQSAGRPEARLSTSAEADCGAQVRWETHSTQSAVSTWDGHGWPWMAMDGHMGQGMTGASAGGNLTIARRWSQWNRKPKAPWADSPAKEVKGRRFQTCSDCDTDDGFNMFQQFSTCFSMFSLHCRLWIFNIFRFRIIMASSLQQFSKLRFWRPCSAWECGDLYRLRGVMTCYTTMRMLQQWDSEMLLGPRCLWTLYILSDISFVSYHISSIISIVHPVFHPFFMGFTVFTCIYVVFSPGFLAPPFPRKRLIKLPGPRRWASAWCVARRRGMAEKHRKTT